MLRLTPELLACLAVSSINLNRDSQTGGEVRNQQPEFSHLLTPVS